MAKSVRVINLPKPTHRLFVRALSLSRGGSQAQWIQSQIRKFIIEQQKIYGSDLLPALTEEQKQLMGAIRDGAALIDQIAKETLIDERRVRVLLAELVEANLIVARPQPKGKGAMLYFISEE